MEVAPIHVAFTGTRNGCQQAQLRSLVAVVSAFDGLSTVFHHGDCMGADEEFHQVAQVFGDVVIHPGLDVNGRKSKWEADCAERSPMCGGSAYTITVLPPKRYLHRNRDMVDVGRVLISCPKEDYIDHELLSYGAHGAAALVPYIDDVMRGGTGYTTAYAVVHRKPVVLIVPDGRIYVHAGTDTVEALPHVAPLVALGLAPRG